MTLALRSQLRMSYLRIALVTAPAILLLGTISGRISNSGYGNPWFDALVKPDIMPPGWLFGVAWTILYILMGLAVAMILHARGARGRGLAVGIFAAQLVLNLAWSPLFFAFHRVSAAFFLILVMLVLAAWATILFARIRKGAALLMLPYLAWLCFASLLNYRIMELNPNAESLAAAATSADIRL